MLDFIINFEITLSGGFAWYFLMFTILGTAKIFADFILNVSKRIKR